MGYSRLLIVPKIQLTVVFESSWWLKKRSNTEQCQRTPLLPRVRGKPFKPAVKYTTTHSHKSIDPHLSITSHRTTRCKICFPNGSTNDQSRKRCTRNAFKWQFVASNIATVFSTRSKNVDSMLVVSSLNWKAPREYRSIASSIISLALTWILTRVSLVTLLDTSHRLVISMWTTIDSSQIPLTSPKLSSQSRQQTTDNRQQTTGDRRQTTGDRRLDGKYCCRIRR